MIRHFFHSLGDGFPSEIRLLSIGVMQPTLLTLLVFALILATFPFPSFRTAGLAAVALASLAAPTDKENLLAERTKATSENELWGSDHVRAERNWTKAAYL